MAKKILILSASLRAGSNSEALANAFADGARAAGHTVEIVSLRGKQIAFCRGCLACQTLGKCVIDDDAVATTEKMQHADVIVFATPIYYYEMSGQLKTMLDRANALFPLDYAFRDIYLLASATEDEPDTRYALRQTLNAQRTADYKAGTYQRAGGVVDPVPEDAPFFVKDYHDYYKTPRGYHPRSLNSTGGWNVTSPLSLLNAKLLAYADEIRSAVLMIHGDKAHSCYFSRDAFARLQGDNKELLLIPGAVHTDLYDRMDIIPFDRIEAFYHQYLK